MPKLQLFQRFYLLLFVSLLVYMVLAMLVRHTVLDGLRVERISVFDWGGWMISLALLVSAAAYPFARRLSRQLEHLQEAVMDFGAGNLHARAMIDGGDEVAGLARGFNDAATRIEALLAAQRRLLAHASHELRTPLTRIRLGVELLASASPDASRKAALASDLRELDDLIEEILLASRLDALAEQAEANESVDMLALVAEECTRYEEARMHFELGANPTASTQLRGDPRLLRRLVRNLLENARRHGQPPTRIELRETSDALELLVQDAGAGVEDDEFERVFEPFQRGRGGRENIGVGLGLTLVRQIARHHRGEAICERGDPGGSRFRVRLPR